MIFEIDAVLNNNSTGLKSGRTISLQNYNCDGNFTLSLDCEGLWGMADNAKAMESGAINSSALGEVYAFIERVLGDNGITATAAFVGAFAVPKASLLERRAQIEEIAAHASQWFACLLPRLHSGTVSDLDGLLGHSHWHRLACAGHEMAWHGATHLPLGDETPNAAVELELELAEALFCDLGHKPVSIIFPRNQVGHLDTLRRRGFTSYRASRNAKGLASRLAGLAREFHVLDVGDTNLPVIQDGWCVSPAGHFLNWPSGPRAAVPASITMRRWRSILKAAAEHGRSAHMWFHPHNMITAPAMRPVFESLVKDIGAMVRSGHLRNLTMDQLAQSCMRSMA